MSDYGQSTLCPLLVFGLDGASMALMNHYVERHPDGIFGTMCTRGFKRTLRSTLPYFTAPAWTTCATGLDPSQHGLFHWRGRYSADSQDRPLLSSLHLADATLWARCEAHGGKACVTNFPMQYPAPATKGAYICGTLAPEDAEQVSQPAALIDRVRRDNPSFRFEMNKGLSYMDRPAELCAHILETGAGHTKALELALGTERFDLCFHVVTITDRMQHFFWHLHDPSHPKHSPALLAQLGDPITEVYSRAEKCLESLWRSGHWENVLILSDHGMGPSFESFHTDVWLAQQGMAVFGANGKVAPGQSLAYAGEEPECAIYLNIKERDGHGCLRKESTEILERLRTDLLALERTSGERAFEDVITAHEAYPVKGRFTELAPDLILLPSNGLHPCPGPATALFSPSTRLYSGHRRDGILLGWGSAFAEQCRVDSEPPLEMTDVFPLCCALLGIPVPHGLRGAIDPRLATTAPSHPPIAGDDMAWPERAGSSVIPQSFSDELMNRLAELGYV